MTSLDRFVARAGKAWRDRSIVVKATSFALVGVVNTVIDASVFFLGYAALGSTPAGIALLRRAADLCDCGGPSTLRLIGANALAWIIAVTCSYVMNSFITFAAESGRALGWRRYGGFVASGVVGAIVNTAVLVFAARVLPVWGAKALAILASFVVNFSLSHFVVFRPRPGPP